MISPRRFLLVLSLALLAGWIVTGAVRSSPETPTIPTSVSTPVVVEGVRVQVELPDESKTIKLDTEPMFATLRFKPHYGTVEFDTAKLKQVIIEKVEGDSVRASVELIDGHMVHG